MARHLRPALLACLVTAALALTGCGLDVQGPNPSDVVPTPSADGVGHPGADHRTPGGRTDHHVGAPGRAGLPDHRPRVRRGGARRLETEADQQDRRPDHRAGAGPDHLDPRAAQPDLDLPALRRHGRVELLRRSSTPTAT